MLYRVLERIVKDRFLQNIKENDLLSPNQHGFTTGRSCMTSLLETMEYITKMSDLGVPVDEVFLDFSNAFDKVPHHRLLFKLHKLGIHGDVLAWIESFLVGRTQKVRVKRSLSKAINATSGLPQGSILGPIPFLLYINDLPHTINAKHNIFADDTNIYSRIENEDAADALQEDLNRMVE